MSNSTPMSARERITALLDDNTFVETGAKVSARNTDFNMVSKETPADGVITGYGIVGDRVVYVYSQDISVLNGSVGEMHAKKITKLYDLAIKTGSPIVGMIDCAGMRLQEATDALDAFGQLYLKQVEASGIVPQITAIFGGCGGGAALIPAMTDFTVMSEDGGKLFVNSPNALDNNEVSKCDTSSAAYQAAAGLVDVVAKDDMDVIENIATLLAFLPSNNLEDAFCDCQDDLNRENPALGTMENIQDVLKDISDNYGFYETKKDFGKEVVTGLLKLDGMTIGAVANSETVLSADGAKKAAEFVKFCDAFEIPVLTLVNVTGYKATKDEEKNMAGAVGAMTAAFASATVAKVTVVTGDALGSAYLAMNSKHVGADVVFAYPTAHIGMMAGEAAAKIMYADEIGQAEDKVQFISQKAAEYEAALSGAEAAAKRGYIDDIIEPAATRKRVIAAFEMLLNKDVNRSAARKHRTI